MITALLISHIIRRQLEGSRRRQRHREIQGPDLVVLCPGFWSELGSRTPGPQFHDRLPAPPQVYRGEDSRLLDQAIDNYCPSKHRHERLSSIADLRREQKHENMCRELLKIKQ